LREFGEASWASPVRVGRGGGGREVDVKAVARLCVMSILPSSTTHLHLPKFGRARQGKKKIRKTQKKRYIDDFRGIMNM
jgi:hypothetical protein